MILVAVALQPSWTSQAYCRRMGVSWAKQNEAVDFVSLIHCSEIPLFIKSDVMKLICISACFSSDLLAYYRHISLMYLG